MESHPFEGGSRPFQSWYLLIKGSDPGSWWFVI